MAPKIPEKLLIQQVRFIVVIGVHDIMWIREDFYKN